jgi:hypothetical protein
MVVGPDKEEAFAAGRVRIDGDYRDASGNGLIDVVGQQAGFCDMKENASRFFMNRLLESLLLGFQVIVLRADELSVNF